MSSALAKIGDVGLVLKVEQAKTLLAEAVRVDEARNIRDQAHAIRMYLRKQKASVQVQRDAAEIELRATRRIGELQREAPKNKGTRGQGRPTKKPAKKGGSNVKPPNNAPPTLAEKGLNKAESSRAQQVASVPKAIFERVALGAKPTVAETVRRANEASRTEAQKKAPKLPDSRFATLVLDPPWRSGARQIPRSGRPAQLGEAYPTMSDDEIAALDIPSLARETSHLYLWSTHRQLPFCFKLLEKWGFQFHCLLTWVKPVGMTPYSFMFSTEHALFAYRGKFEVMKKGQRVDFTGKSREHSRKPDEFYELVRQASPGPRLEMFSREEHEGFTAWGLEAGKFGSLVTTGRRNSSATQLIQMSAP